MSDSKPQPAPETPLPSNRQFGLVFVGFFAIVAALGWWRGWAVTPWVLGASVLTAVVTFTVPQVLTPLNRAWMKLAELLHRIVSPIILGVMFYGVFTPVGFGMRLFGRDVMQRRWQPERASYWVPREPPGPPPGSLDNQF
jgi:hypothetical protein